MLGTLDIQKPPGIFGLFSLLPIRQSQAGRRELASLIPPLLVDHRQRALIVHYMGPVTDSGTRSVLGR